MSDENKKPMEIGDSVKFISTGLARKQPNGDTVEIAEAVHAQAALDGEDLGMQLILAGPDQVVIVEEFGEAASNEETLPIFFGHLKQVAEAIKAEQLVFVSMGELRRDDKVVEALTFYRETPDSFGTTLYPVFNTPAGRKFGKPLERGDAVQWFYGLIFRVTPPGQAN